jgi:hypothetical protein
MIMEKEKQGYPNYAAALYTYYALTLGICFDKSFREQFKKGLEDVKDGSENEGKRRYCHF